MTSFREQSPLESNRQLFSLICIYPAAKDASLCSKALKFSLSFAMTSVTMCGLIGSFTVFIQEFENDFQAAISALFQISTLTTALYTLFAAFSLRSTIFKIFVQLQDIYESSKCFIFDAMIGCPLL